MIDIDEIEAARQRSALSLPSPTEPPPVPAVPAPDRGPSPKAVTAEARLVANGWKPPTDALWTAIERREALRGAVAALKGRGRAADADVAAAIEAGDVAAVIGAIHSLAVHAWLDAHCQNPSSALTAWSAAAEQRLIDAIYVAPGAIVASLEGVDSPDAHWLRSEATTAVGSDLHMVDAQGQPARRRPDPVSFHRILIPR